MGTGYDLISLIDTLGLFQGLILGLLLIVLDTKKKSTLWLGFFIIAYALELLPRILKGLSFTADYNVISLGLAWLLFPLFYIYVQKISILSNETISYWTLIPGGLYIGGQIGVYLLDLDIENKLQHLISFDYIVEFFYAIFVASLILRWIKRHKNKVRNQYTALEYKELSWARNFVVIGVLFTVVMTLFTFFYSTYYITLTGSIINVALLYWISIRGILQKNVEELTYIATSKKDFTEKRAIIPKPNTIDGERDKALILRLTACIRDEELFRKTDLTIMDVAEKLEVHPKRISTVINSSLWLNFNSYINQFRIEKAKQLLKSENSKNYSIEGIGYEVGFQSKSAFYEAFKKNAGVTPLKYKKA